MPAESSGYPGVDYQLTDEQRALAERNIDLVGSFLKSPRFREYVQEMGWDDAYQEASIGLMRAAKRFDKSLGFQFSTLVRFGIATQLRLAERRRNKRLKLSGRRECGKRPTVRVSQKFDLVSEASGPHEAAESSIDAGLIMSVLKNKRDRQVVRLVARGLTHREIGDRLGFSHQESFRRWEIARSLIRSSFPQYQAE